MPEGPLLVTHATEDDAVAERLAKRLERLGVKCWVDSEDLRPGDRLAPTIEEALRKARSQVVPVTMKSARKPWALRELEWGRKVEDDGADGFRVIPVLWDLRPEGLPVQVRPLTEHIAVDMDDGHRFGFGIRQVLYALGEIVSPGPVPLERPVPRVHELVLQLTEPRLVEEEAGGVKRQRVDATLRLLDEAGGVLSAEGPFHSPIGRLEASDLRW